MEKLIVNGVLALDKIEKEVGGKMGTLIGLTLVAIVAIFTLAAMAGIGYIGFKVCDALLYYFTGYTLV